MQNSVSSSIGQVNADEFLRALTEEERAWLREHPVIRVAQDPNWPPIEFVDEHGVQSGMTADYLQLIEQRLGLKFKRVPNLSWQEAYSRMKRREIDMTTTVAMTSERTAFWAFTKPYMSIPIVIVTAADVTYIGDPHELEGKKVAVVAGYIAEVLLARDFPRIQRVAVNTTEECLAAVQRGDVSACIENMLVVSYYLSMLKMTDLKIAGSTNYTNAQRMAVRKDWLTLAVILDKALESISATERAEIYRRWLPVRYEYGFNYTRLWQLAGVFALILIGLVAWNARLAREVEQRKRAETTTAQTLGRLTEAQRIGQIGDWEFEIATQKITWSPQTFAILGRDPSLGPPRDLGGVASMYDAPSRALLEEKVARAIASGEPQDYELVAQRPDGERVHVHANAVPRKDASGRVVGLFGTVQDVTKRKQAEAALSESKASLNEAQRIARLGSYVFDFATGVWTSSRIMDELLGIGESYDKTMVGWMALMHPDDQATMADHVENDMSQLPAFEMEFRIIRQTDHAERWLRSWASLERDTEGRARRLLGTSQDITERKQAELALHESLSLIKVAGRIAHFGGWSVNLADGLQTWSDEVACIHEEPPGFVPSVTDGINYYAPEWREKIAAVFGECVRHGTPYDEEMQIITAAGRRVWVRAVGEAVRDEAGIIVRVQGAFQNIDERKQAEEQVLRLNSELEQRVTERTAELQAANVKLQTYSATVSDALRAAETAEQTKARFLATMSHELRTPLNSIIGFTDIMLEGLAGPVNPEQAKQLTIVRGSGRHLLDLINDVLDISKIEAGKFEVRAEPLDLHATIERVTATIQPLADKKGLTLTAVVAPTVSEIVSDRLRVEQILLNLLSNAVKFTERGGVTFTVDMVPGLKFGSGPAPHPAVRFRVRDSGIGVKPEDLATLFEAFRQAEGGRARLSEGTGLGLAISRRLATLLGGEISAVSEWGTGSTFTLILPLVMETEVVQEPIG